MDNSERRFAKPRYIVPEASDNPLRRRRGQLQMSLPAMEAVLGIGEISIGQWENGHHPFRYQKIRLIAEAYQISLQRAVEIYYELALGRELTGAGVEHPEINRYSLCNWLSDRIHAHVAREAGCFMSNLCEWINGDRMVSPHKIEGLARVIGKTETEVALASFMAWDRNKGGIK